ncbi:hypothetical protein STEG23_016101 [Scotinomys teguina]
MLRAGAACHFGGSWPHGRRELRSCESSSMYLFPEKEWLITHPSRYGAVVFENNPLLHLGFKPGLDS